jgi:hypothetical protein
MRRRRWPGGHHRGGGVGGRGGWCRPWRWTGCDHRGWGLGFFWVGIGGKLLGECCLRRMSNIDGRSPLQPERPNDRCCPWRWINCGNEGGGARWCHRQQMERWEGCARCGMAVIIIYRSCFKYSDGKLRMGPSESSQAVFQIFVAGHPKFKAEREVIRCAHRVAFGRCTFQIKRPQESSKYNVPRKTQMETGCERIERSGASGRAP